MKVLRPNFEKGGGLVAVVLQDSLTMENIMFAWANEEAWRKTLETGVATLFSRSRNKLWTKGEESGNIMEANEIRVDCDGDSLIYFVTPKGEGKACHTNALSCFYRSCTGKHPDDPAPNAGPKEELPFVEAEVHSRLRPAQSGTGTD